MDNTMTMRHVNASVNTYQLAILLMISTRIHVNASVDHMNAMLVNILTISPVAVDAQSTRPAQAISTSTVQLVSVNAVTSRNVGMDNTMTMIHANASVEIHQLANIHSITTQTPVSVIVDHMIATRANTLTQRAVVANAQSTRPAQTISTSMIQLVSVNVTK